MLPDGLLPRTAWLYAVMPLPRFPLHAADAAFGLEDVVGTRADAAARAFKILEGWGYRAIGKHRDAENDVEVLGYSSDSATVWVVFVTGLLMVFVTPRAEVDPARFNHHLAADHARAEIAAWGAFPVEAGHVPAAARAFQKAGQDLLQGGAPNFRVLGRRLEASATAFSEGVRRREGLANAEKLARAGRHKAAARILAYWEPDLLPDQRRLLETERQAAIVEPPLLEHGAMSDREWFIARAELITAKHLALKFPDSPAEAATDFHEARDLLYDDLEAAISRSRQGDTEAIEYLITFVEVDPWCFRSGYMKGRIYELLRRGNYDESGRQRLRAVLPRLVDAGYRTEFRSACRLARQVADPGLIEDLRLRLAISPDRHVRRRAVWMLCYMPTGLEEQDAGVLQVVLDAAGEKDWWRASDWVRPLCKRFATDEFGAKIRRLAFSSDAADARRGLRLLPCAIRQPLDAAERLTLESTVLEGIHGRGPAAGLVESLAPVADTRRFRTRLTELAERAGSPVNDLARWTLKAAIRANGDQAPDL